MLIVSFDVGGEGCPLTHQWSTSAFCALCKSVCKSIVFKLYEGVPPGLAIDMLVMTTGLGDLATLYAL
jgi:hypothetical protein